MNWKVGQQVYCLKNGGGVIRDIDETVKYCISVEFPGSWQRYNYTNSGHLNELDATPMLYHAKPGIIVPKWQPEPNQWCWFWDSEDSMSSLLCQFLRMNEYNLYQSKTGALRQNCAPFIGELPTHLKEGDK
jgi:hypothetical protein